MGPRCSIACSRLHAGAPHTSPPTQAPRGPTYLAPEVERVLDHGSHKGQLPPCVTQARDNFSRPHPVLGYCSQATPLPFLLLLLRCQQHTSTRSQAVRRTTTATLLVESRLKLEPADRPSDHTMVHL